MCRKLSFASDPFQEIQKRANNKKRSLLGSRKSGSITGQLPNTSFQDPKNHTITDGGSTTELYPVWWRWDLTTPRTLLYSGTKTMPCQITPSQMGVAPPERSPVLWRWNISQTTTTPRTLLYSGAKTKFYQKWDVFVGAANTVMPRRIYLHFALFTTQSEAGATNCAKRNLNTVRISFTFSLTKVYA